MNVTVNGEERALEEATTIAQVVESSGGGGRGVAVAVNGEVVPRSHWADRVLGSGDRVEILRAVGGG